MALQQERYTKGEKHLSYPGLCKHLKDWKANSKLTWLNEVHSQVLQQVLKDLGSGYRNFFERRAERPTFKKKGQHDSFWYPQGVKLDQANGRIFLPKIGWMRYRASRAAEGGICQVTVTHSGDKWFISVQTEREVKEPVRPATSIIGIDMGVARFAMLSNGEVVEPQSAFCKAEKRLARAQRRMSKRQKFSQNGKKAKARVQQVQARIARIRKDRCGQDEARVAPPISRITLD